jgi:hypothetical protein
VGLFDAVRGRRKPSQPNLDALFALPSAAITLQAAMDFTPTGCAAVSFRSPEGRAFADVRDEVVALLDADGGPPVELTEDEFGFTWVLIRTEPADLPTAVTDAHAVNTSLVAAGFGPQLLCTVLSFRDPGARILAMVYLFKRGTFYPFAPASADAGETSRDNVLELQVRDRLTGELPVEQQIERWFAVWGAPGL